MKKIISVDSDTDGTACKLLFTYFDHEAKIIQSSVGPKVDGEISNLNLDDYDFFGFADLVPSRDIYEKLLATGKPVYIWDHHETSRRNLEGISNPDYHYDLERCSAKLVYDYYRDTKEHNQCLKEYVDRVNAYDLWHDDESLFEDGKNLNNILFWFIRDSRWKSDKVGYDRFIDLQLKKVYMHPHFTFLDFEQEIIEKENEKEDKKFKKVRNNISFRKDSEGRLYGYFELDSKVSIVCSRILKEFKELSYVMCYNLWEDNGKFSLRTRREDLNMAKLAEKIMKGAGGHKKAAGLRFEGTQPDFVSAIREGKHII